MKKYIMNNLGHIDEIDDKPLTAYELADELEWHWDNDCRSPAISKSADMLRQQADRIAELEKEVKRLVGAEPITHGRLTFCKNCGQQDPYTQTKPLSDEEIDSIIYSVDWAYDPVLLARAIEERHGIK